MPKSGQCSLFVPYYSTALNVAPSVIYTTKKPQKSGISQYQTRQKARPNVERMSRKCRANVEPM
jgi:hypothetical protein